MTIEEYGKIDNSFNRSKFIGSVNKMIQSIYMAISSDDLESVKTSMDEKTYNQLLDRVDRIKNGLTLKYDNIFIDSEIKGISMVRGVPTIDINSTCSYSKYFLDNGKIVRGSDTDIMQVTHSFSLRKKEDAIIYYQCDGCGLSYNMREKNVCPSCGRPCDLEVSDYYIVGMV